MLMDVTLKPKRLPFTLYAYDAELALAFQTDCEKLLQKFSDRNCFRFRTFAEVWRELGFSAVFGGQKYLLMLKTYIENCFFVSNKFLFSPDPYVQAGSLFLLYSLYYKQPIRQWVKIRLTQLVVEKINEICERHKADDYPELLYIYCRMRLDGAFIYCALPQPYGLDPQYIKRVDISSEEIGQHKERESAEIKVKALLEDPLLSDIEDTNREYQKLANKFKGKHPELFVFPSSIQEDVCQTWKILFEGYQDGNNDEQDRLKDLKERAMSSANATYRGERAVVTAIDFRKSAESRKK